MINLKIKAWVVLNNIPDVNFINHGSHPVNHYSMPCFYIYILFFFSGSFYWRAGVFLPERDKTNSQLNIKEVDFFPEQTVKYQHQFELTPDVYIKKKNVQNLSAVFIKLPRRIVFYSLDAMDVCAITHHLTNWPFTHTKQNPKLNPAVICIAVYQSSVENLHPKREMRVHSPEMVK